MEVEASASSSAAAASGGSGASTAGGAVFDTKGKAGELELEVPFVEKYRPILVRRGAGGGARYTAWRLGVGCDRQRAPFRVAACS